jgi:D-xylose transport system permease protein
LSTEFRWGTVSPQSEGPTLSTRTELVEPVATRRKDPRSLLPYSRLDESAVRRSLVLIGVIALVWVTFHFVTSGVFVSPRNLTNLSVQVSVTAIVGVGETWLLIARQIDLSSGALIAFISVIVAEVQVNQGWSVAVTLLIAVVVGVVCGALNGVLVTLVGIPAFIATLAAFSYLRGSAYLMSNGDTIAGMDTRLVAIGNGDLKELASVLLVIVATAVAAVVKGRQVIRERNQGTTRPSQLILLGLIVFAGVGAAWVFGSYRGLPFPVLILAVVFGVASFVANQTRFGRYIYAIGGSPESARRSGIKSGRILLTLFVIAGLCAAIGAIIQVSRLDAGAPSTAELQELACISAAVIGGASLFGGRGRLLGTALGALLMASIANGLSLAGVNTFWQQIATGVLLVVAVATDRRTRKENRL